MSSMDSFASWSGRPVADLKSQLYTHLAHCRRQEPPDQVLQRFQTLFVEGEGEGYPDKAIWETLLELIYSPEAEREFKYTLNRCSYTLVNPWYTQPRDHWAIPALVELFDDIPARNGQISDAAYRIRRLSQQFTETDQFAALQRFADLVRPGGDEGVDFSEQPVARQLRRYPFLYDSQLLVTKDSDQAQREHARELRQQGEAQLGVKLARWARRQADKPFPNPTRLGNEELQAALHHYTGKVSGHRSQRDMAHMFAAYSRTVRSFRDFKEEFLEYLIAPLASVDPRYDSHTFTRTLRAFVRQTLSEFDDQIPKEYTIVSFCQKLVTFLVAEGRKNPIFRRFRSLLADAGHILTLGLLLRVVLFCERVKPWLENRLAVLFKHHEQSACGEAAWFVKVLEHTNVALTTNFNRAYSF
jgi:hypothetical protein